ncbi:rab-like protein 6 isoform X1 [Montipora foliosa]|uniref:rab-like protein 6 isoform X1 n=1 Tax=Montipora foliosa TaxID=591990 RepID=UPI0035F1A176
MLSAFKKWAKGGNENSKLSTPMGVRAMGQALQRKFARGIQYNLKIVIKGDRNTGKSCLFQRLQGKPFSEQYIPTNEIQVASIHWNYKTTDDVVKVEVWDVVDKGKSKKSSSSGLKLETDKIESEKDESVLDAEFVDVYKGAHGVLLVMDITKPWTFKYVERELGKVPPHLPVLVLANHRDMGEHRLVQTDEAVAVIEHLERPDRSPPVHYAETSMKNGFGLKYIHKFLNLPFLLLQRETLLKQLQVNAEDTESTLEELQIHKETEEQDYEKFVSMLEKRRKDHQARKAAASAEGGDAMESGATSLATPHTGAIVEATEKRADNKESSQGNTTARKELRQEAVSKNGPVHSSADIDEFMPDDEMDAGFLDEDKSGSGKRTNNSVAKKLPAKVEVMQGGSEESDSDSETRNPMVAGFAEDIDSDDETAVSAAMTNHVEDFNMKNPLRTVTKPSAVVTVNLTSSEEEEEEEKSDEEPKGNESKKMENEDKRTEIKEFKKEPPSNGLKMNLKMPDSASTTQATIDSFSPIKADVDDWLNSPDTDPKVSPIERELTEGRKTSTPSQASSSLATDIAEDEWERFMTSQMQPQSRRTRAAPDSLMDMNFDEENNVNGDEKSKSRKKKEQRSGEKSKSKHKHRKHKDKTEENEAEGDKKERRKSSRQKDGDEGKEKKKSKDDEGEKKKKRRSKHNRSKDEKGDEEGVTYEEL